MAVKKPKENDIKLALMYANYIINTFSTIKATAKAFNVTKGFVNYRIYNVLPIVNEKLYMRLKKVTAQNSKEMDKRSLQAKLNKGSVTKKQLEDFIFNYLRDNITKTLSLRDMMEGIGKSYSQVYEIVCRITQDETSDIILVDRNIRTAHYTFKLKTSSDDVGIKLRCCKTENRKKNREQKNKVVVQDAELTTVSEVKVPDNDSALQIKWEF